jgi:SPX domain protein involved in polyphosphate accumulation
VGAQHSTAQHSAARHSAARLGEMKFCKAQEAFLAETMPEWAPYCVDYKNAKKMLNALIPVKERRPLRAVSAAEMSACREEVAFFRLLRIEVDKVNTFSMSMRQQMELRSKSLNDGIRSVSALPSTMRATRDWAHPRLFRFAFAAAPSGSPRA